MRVTKEEAQTLLEAYGTLHGFWMMDRDGRGTCELADFGELLSATMAGAGVSADYKIDMMPLSAKIRAELRDELLGATPTEKGDA